MMAFLEFTLDQATIIAILLPIVAVCVSIIVIPWMKNGSGSKFRRYLSYLINPPAIGTNQTDIPESETEQADTTVRREDKVRLYFYYLAIVLFLVSFIIGEFYEVMIDLSLPVNQGSTGEFRTVTSIILQSPFNAGWIGVLPWVGFSSYHETWNWILFTTALTDNPHFLSTLVTVLVPISIVVGCVFLAPLTIRSIRHSFLPSMFFFMTGMTIFTKAALGYFAGALKLLFSSIEYQYLNVAVTGNMIPNFSGVMTSCILLVLPMYVLFVVLGRKLWNVYYTDSESKTWFTVYITLSFWIGLILMVVVV
ncbi:hypothetical protein EU528_02720 [Candidatus Thorarchaeota archaeon]|nr:MAG: hypothetical protein EU528_02720 [Candidatus Thorarchaeota archaeon]